MSIFAGTEILKSDMYSFYALSHFVKGQAVFETEDMMFILSNYDTTQFSYNYKSNHDVVNITPFPCLTWLKRSYDGMFSSFEMFCCMLIRGRITAAYMTTRQT
jgi:hypothetical protein